MKNFDLHKFKINAYTPDTLPMARCANYLEELAAMLGETPYVHFVRLDKGSTVIVHRIDKEAVPRVRERTEAVRQAKGTMAEMRAYRRLNRMLAEDNGTGVLLGKRNVEIIRFPGKEEEALKISSMQQRGTIEGEVIRVGGSRSIVPILLYVEGKEIPGCHARRAIAKELAKNLFEPVRLFGEGRWERSAEGEWNLIHFMVDRFDVMEKTSLSDAINELRQLKGEWGKTAIDEILESRRSNEGH